MIPLSEKDKALHARALTVGKSYRRAEVDLIQILQEVYQARLFAKLELANLFQYATQELGLSRPVAGIFISVAKKALAVPELQKAIYKGNLTVSVASKLVSTINPKNSHELIEFAKTHTCRELEHKVAGLNPEIKERERVRAVSDKLVRIEYTLTLEEYEMLCRVRELESQRMSAARSLKDASVAGVKTYLEKNDPLKKAVRAQALAQKRTQKREKIPKAPVTSEEQVVKQHSSREESKGPKRVPIKAETKHLLNLKTGTQCTYVDRRGGRCSNTRWIHIHHIKPVSQGGTNLLQNLTHLCWHHHDLIHQMEFENLGFYEAPGKERIELKAPWRRYSYPSLGIVLPANLERQY